MSVRTARTWQGGALPSEHKKVRPWRTRSGPHTEDVTLWLAADYIHPNERGHHEVRQVFLAAVDGALPLPIPEGSG